MKFLFSIILIGVFSIAFVECRKSNPVTAGTGNVMFVNGFTSEGNMDVAVNGIKLLTASNLSFSQNSGYRTVISGSNVDFSFGLTGQQINNGFGVQILPDSSYSIFVGGSSALTIFSVSSDDLSMPGSGMVKVRFVNLSVDSLNLDCFIGNQKIDSDVYGVTSFFSLKATSTVGGDSILLRDPVRSESAILRNQFFVAGHIYTIVFTGNTNGVLNAEPKLVVINNE